MNQIENAFVKNYKEVIDFIANNVNNADDKTRHRIASILGNALKMSRIRARMSGKNTPNIVDPKHTALYKMALLVGDSKTFDEFKDRAKIALPKYKIPVLLEFCNLDWNFNFDIPIVSKSTENAGRLNAILKTKPVILPTPNKIDDEIKSLRDDFNTLENAFTKSYMELTKMIKEELEINIKEINALKSVLKNHAHIGDKLYIAAD